MRTIPALALACLTLVTTAQGSWADESRPHVGHVNVTGDAHTKGTLSAAYRYQGSRHAQEGETAFRWLSSATPHGLYTQIPGAYDQELPLSREHDNSYVRVEVTPVTEDGVAGEPERSEPVKVLPRNGNPNTDWMQDGKYGLADHYLRDWIDRVAATAEEKVKPGESWDDILTTFDVHAYVEDVRRSGASFVLLTLGQNSGYYLAPNRTYERIAGLQPGERTPSRRDLPMEIADALAPYGIKLVLYAPAQPPSRGHKVEGDFAITDAFDKMRNADGPPSQSQHAKWHAVLKEWSGHYGTKVAGWWFDGMQTKTRAGFIDYDRRYSHISYGAVAKAGNPNAIVAFNGGVARALVTEHPSQDISAGETNTPTSLPTERWSDRANGVQWMGFMPLGDRDPYWGGWGNKSTEYDAATVAAWVKNITDKGGVTILDAKVNRFGRLDPAQLAQLELVKSVIRDGAPLPQ